jgi:hypothetical protein
MAVDVDNDLWLQSRRIGLAYQNQVMVAMQARAAVTRIEQTTAGDALSAPSGADYAASAWRDIAPSARSAHQAAQAV